MIKNLKFITSLQIIVITFCIFDSFECRLHKSDLNPHLQSFDVFFYDSSAGKTQHNSNLHLEVNNMSCGELKVDQSCLIVQSYVERKIQFLYQSMECDNCSLLEMEPLKPLHSHKVIFNLASLGTEWKVLDYERNITLCNLSQNYLGENSWYHLQVNQTGCTLVCDKEPDDVYYPLLIALGFYILLALVFCLGRITYRSAVFNRLLNRNSLDDLAAAFSSSSTVDDVKQKTPQQRLRSLDAVRGISIVVMIFVNYGGGQYQFFEHSYWNGLTVADLVFPWFIWMMGMSMAFSMKSQLRRIVSRRKIFLKIVRRSLTLFALGLMLNTICLNIDLRDIRIPGVLQRFGVSYFVVASVHLFYASADNEPTSGSLIRDITAYGVEWLIILTMLATHLLLVFFIHSPDCPPGYMGPGGLHDQGAYSSCIGGAAGYIDRVLLGRSHLYQKAGAIKIYDSSLPYDPEGILGCLTSIFLVFLGLQAGKILLIYYEHKSRIIRWMIWGTFTGSVAGVLCCFSKNDGWIPINKNLWSVSFVLATGGLAFILITFCYYIIDVKKWWSGAPFYQAGMNSILLYVGHEITHNMFPWSFDVTSNHMSQLFMDLWGTSLWIIIAVWMHRIGVFLTI